MVQDHYSIKYNKYNKKSVMERTVPFENAIDGEKTIIFSDKHNSYVKIADYVEIYMS